MNKALAENTSELETNILRSSVLSDVLFDTSDYLKCYEHGAPSPLIKWHHHKEYELHLITSTKGKMFVGDYIGRFEPGNLVLTGPFLPHNWVSDNLPEDGLASRDISLHFEDEPFRKACGLFNELAQVLPLLDRAKNGVEFYGVTDFAKQQLLKIKNSQGLESFSEFLVLMSRLSRVDEYQLLSNKQLQSCNDNYLKEIKDVVDYITANYSSQFSMVEIAEQVGMSGSQFSRVFRKETGITFRDFVNHLRINSACKLLAETKKYISTIGYEVGYNNVANFNRRFIENRKITPSEYRRQSRKKFS